MTNSVDRALAGLNWRDYGGSGQTMVLVHGLGGSLINWDAVGPRLAKDRRVVAADLPGFGFSPPRDNYDLKTHAAAVVEFIDEFETPVALMGNSMGGLICEMVASEHPDLVESLILVSPATPPRLPDTRLHWPTVTRLFIEAIPGVGYAFGHAIKARYTPEQIVHLGLEAITHDPSRVPPHVVESLVDMAEQRVHLPWAVPSLNQTAFEIAMMYRRPRDFVRMIRRIRARTLVVHGLGDRIVSPTAIEWLCSLRRDWDLAQMEDTGHTPQLDAPVRFTTIVDEWLEGGDDRDS
ncbi:MAG: alpha/beta hydrolase [Actinobacteria bacterium]|nr:MAG: alpha/beta hydrolase [Actinomycetota bacterium]